MQLASRLRRFPVRLAALALALVPLASGSPPAADGALAGRYVVVSSRTTVLDGRIETPGLPDLDAQALLIGGRDSGGLWGRFVEIQREPSASGFRLEYDVVGQYVLGTDGVVRIEAQVYLDLRSQGLPVYLHAGELQGRLSRPIGAGSAPGFVEDPNEPAPARGAFAARIEWL